MHCTGNKNRTEWNHMLFYPSSIFDPGRLNSHVNKKLNGVEQRIHNLIAAFHLRRAKCSGKTLRIWPLLENLPRTCPPPPRPWARGGRPCWWGRCPCRLSPSTQSSGRAAHLDYKDFQNLFIKINRRKIKIARLLRKKRDLESYQNLNIFLWYHDCEILVDRSDDNLLTVRSLSTCTLMVFCSFLAL